MDVYFIFTTKSKYEIKQPQGASLCSVVRTTEMMKREFP